MDSDRLILPIAGYLVKALKAAEDPQHRANRMILETVHPRADAVTVLGTPLRIQNHERRARKNAPPELGEHNHETLRIKIPKKRLC
jgi:crotonobetainyl-CoA:carnitine CoA-transferase CaiB-like acyl-CoA transferase